MSTEQTLRKSGEQRTGGRMKIAIVTGASSGMGRETVYQLAARYAGLSEIWAVARREERLLELVGKVPVRLRLFVLDLTEADDREELERVLQELTPSVKILVNAAGFGKTGAVGEIAASDSAGMIRLNDEALAAVTELVLPFMGKNSRILQFASAAAFLPQPGFAVYAATKAFVLSYSRALAAELAGRGIAVTAVCPGPVDTEFFDIALGGGELKAYKKWVMLKPEQVVSCAIRDAAMGKQVSIPGLPMKLFYLLCRAVPHRVLMRFVNFGSGSAVRHLK